MQPAPSLVEGGAHHPRSVFVEGAGLWGSVMLIIFSAVAILSLLPFMIALFAGRGGWMAVCVIVCMAAPLAAFFTFSQGRHLAFWIEGAGWSLAWLASFMALRRR